jgi:hypothetical protein
MKRSIIVTIAGTVVVGGGLGAAVFASQMLPARTAAVEPKPQWTEVAWPFAMDQWGKGKAFHCRAEHCGSEVRLYLRAKIGFCGCIDAIDDEEVDRVGDLDFLGKENAALGPGRAIDVRWMKGRSRGYALRGNGAGARSALSIAFHDRCDMVVATAAMAHERPAEQEAAVLDFLNSDQVLRWAEVTLGL